MGDSRLEWFGDVLEDSIYVLFGDVWGIVVGTELKMCGVQRVGMG